MDEIHFSLRITRGFLNYKWELVMSEDRQWIGAYKYIDVSIEGMAWKENFYSFY